MFGWRQKPGSIRGAANQHLAGGVVTRAGEESVSFVTSQRAELLGFAAEKQLSVS